MIIKSINYFFLHFQNRIIQQILFSHFRRIKQMEIVMKRVYECANNILKPISTSKISINNNELQSEYYIYYVYYYIYEI